MADSHAPDAAYEGHLTEDHAHPHGVIFLRNRGSRTAAAGAAGWRAGLRSPWMSAPLILSIEVASNIACVGESLGVGAHLPAQQSWGHRCAPTGPHPASPPAIRSYFSVYANMVRGGWSAGAGGANARPAG